MPIKSVIKLNNRAELWKARAQQAFARGDINRGNRLHAKALELQAEAHKIQEKINKNQNY